MFKKMCDNPNTSFSHYFHVREGNEPREVIFDISNYSLKLSVQYHKQWIKYVVCVLFVAR